MAEKKYFIRNRLNGKILTKIMTANKVYSLFEKLKQSNAELYEVVTTTQLAEEKQSSEALPSGDRK